ncbi:hypothetical protein Hypma_001945 [Hypsizygus marmoreus]|uniref:Uncharacterized protein n=1 Tax=Hypsizygus marmoreus TaxID=39966 RepID=A0A369JBH2_HYPMA|nr:hypothetical protein Hypma_001945 [Hypsizygus marmoreus]
MNTSIEASQPLYTILAVKSFLKEGAQETAIHYTQYRGRGSPPKSLGKAGDLFFDLSPGAYRLYARYYDGWREWEGIARNPDKHQAHLRFCHPHDNSRVLWFYRRSLEWRKMDRKDLSSTKHKLFTARIWNTDQEFVSAHTLIERYNIGGAGTERHGRKRTVETEGDSESEVYADEMDTDDEVSISRTYDLRGGSRAQKKMRVEGGSPRAQPDVSGTFASPRTSSAPQRMQRLRPIDSKLPDLRSTPQPSHGSAASPQPRSTSDLTFHSPVRRTYTTGRGGSINGGDERRSRKEEHEKIMSQYRSCQTALEHRHEVVTRENDHIKRKAEMVSERLQHAKREALRRAKEAEERERELVEMEAHVKKVKESMLKKDEELERHKRLIEDMEKEISDWNEI